MQIFRNFFLNILLYIFEMFVRQGFDELLLMLFFTSLPTGRFYSQHPDNKLSV